MDRILILEDDRFTRQLMADTLRSRRYGVFEAGDSKSAERFLGEEEISVALLDVVLPGENGLEFLTRLKGISPSTLCVIVTAFPSTDIAIQALRLGAFDFIKKPFEPEELLHTVNKAIQFRRVNTEKAALTLALENKLLGFQIENSRLLEEQRTVNSALDSIEYGIVFFDEKWNPAYMNRWAKAWLPGSESQEFKALTASLAEKCPFNSLGIEFINALERFYVVRLSPWEDGLKRMGSVAVFADHTALLEYDELKAALVAGPTREICMKFATAADNSPNEGGTMAGSDPGGGFGPVGGTRQDLALDDLLAMLEMGATDLRPYISWADPRTIVDETLSSLMRDTCASWVKTRAHFSQDLPAQILIDVRKTRAILRHFAADTIIHHREGGEILISVSPCPHEPLCETFQRLTSRSDLVPAGWLIFAVENDGPGPEQSFLESMSREFSLDPTTGRMSAGRRELGLRICRLLASAMGARVEIGGGDSGGGYFALIAPFFRQD